MNLTESVITPRFWRRVRTTSPADITPVRRAMGVGFAVALTGSMLLAAPLAAQAAPGDTTVSGATYYDDGVSVTPLDAVALLYHVDESGTPDASFGFRSEISSQGSGYTFHFVDPGLYALCFAVGSTEIEAVQSCWGGTGIATAQVFEVVVDDTLTGFDGFVTPAGHLAGMISGQAGPGDPIIGAQNILIYLMRKDPTTGVPELVRSTQSDSGTDSYWRIDGVPIGTYYLRFYDPNGQYATEWWHDARSLAEATPVVIEAGVTTAFGNGDIVLTERSADLIDVDRITGTDRFGTSVEISKSVFPTVPSAGVPVVYIANGLNYPDALAAGPAAIYNGGIVLLVYPWAIPPLVATELDRLDPQRIVVVGGLPSVDAATYAQLEAYVDDPDDLDRLTGTDRFGTSREIARDTFAPGEASFAFVATGMNYPDALAAGPPAGLYGAPIILVNGAAQTVDTGALEVLDQLEVDFVYIIGGPPSVSTAFENGLKAALGAGAVDRITGSDRFGTAIEIAIEFFPAADDAYLATGLNFPDALAGGPAAGARYAPLYLSRQDCIQAPVLDDIVAVGTIDLHLLGGILSLSAKVENLGVC